MNEYIEKKIARLECWNSAVSIEPLGGGMTNLNFKVTDAGQDYVVRLGEDDAIHLISRSNEAECCRAAYEIGVSPELIYTEPGVLVVRFVEGRVFEEADIRQPQNLARIVDILLQFHHGIPQQFRQIPVIFWVFQVLRHYQYLLKKGHSSYRDRLRELASVAATLEERVGKVDIVFGHNDLLAANFIDDGEKVWLIDFDYAGFNSPLFDLSNLASNNEFSVDEEITMIEKYFGSSINRRHWQSYYAMKCASLLRETLWSMVSEIHSELAVDFEAYTAKNLERFDQAYEEFQREYR